MGIILGDAHLFLFTEDGEHAKETPAHILNSPWTLSNYNKFQNYIQKLQEDLLEGIKLPRCVIY